MILVNAQEAAYALTPAAERGVLLLRPQKTLNSAKTRQAFYLRAGAEKAKYPSCRWFDRLPFHFALVAQLD